MGFKKGDKIVTVSNNRPQWNFVDMGMALAGVVHVPAYTSLNAEEYRYVLEHSDASMLIVSDQKLYELIAPEAAKIKAIKGSSTFGEVAGASSWREVQDSLAGRCTRRSRLPC